MKIPPAHVLAEHRENRIKRMSRRAFMGLGLAAAVASGADASVLWLKKPAASPYFATVTDAASLRTLITAMRSSPATYAGKIIAVADGDYSGGQDGSGARFDFSNITPASTVMFYGLGDNTATWPGINFSDTNNSGSFVGAPTNIIWSRIEQYRGTYDSVGGVCNPTNSTGCGLDGCAIGGSPLNQKDYRFKVSASGGTGSFIDGETLYAVSSLQTPISSTSVRGQYASAGSSGNTICFTLGGANPVTSAIGSWNGKILQNAAGTAWRTLANPCNISSPINGSIVSILSGVLGGATNLYLRNNRFHDVRWAWAGVLPGLDAQYNTMDDVYTSFFDLQGATTGNWSNATVQWNKGSHIWCTDMDGSPGTNGPHSSFSGFSNYQFATVTNVAYRYNVLARGFHRYTLPVSQGGGVVNTPSGPEMNDQGFDGVANNVQGCGGLIGGTGGVSSSTINITAGPAVGVVNVPRIGNAVRWAGGPTDDSVTVTSVTSAGGTAWTIGITPAQSIPNGTQITMTSVNSGWDIRGNLLVGIGNGLGWELAYAKDIKFLWNTILCDLDAPTLVGINRHDIYPGCVISKNISSAFSVRGSPFNPLASGSGSHPGILAPDLYSSSTDNLTAVYYEAATSALSFYSLFHGKTGSGTITDFQQLDADGAITAFANKAGSAADVSKCGATAYVDFVNQTTNFPADPTPISSNVANGITTNKVHADGTTYSRWAAGSGVPLLNMTAPVNSLSVITEINCDASQDGSSFYLQVAKNQAVLLKRNNDGTFTFSLKRNFNASGFNTVEVTTGFTVTSADGWVVLGLFWDAASGRIYATKNNFVDPLLNVTSFSGDPLVLVNGSNNFSINNNYTGTVQEFKGDTGVVSLDSSFVNVGTVAGLSKVVAQDNKPIDYGATGSTLYGHQAVVAINAPAGAAGTPNTWNATGGVNFGYGGAIVKQAGTYT